MPITSEAEDRLSRAIFAYANGTMRIEDTFEVAVIGYGTDQALTALTMALSGKVLDGDLQTFLTAYDGPIVDGYDLALEKSIARRLELGS